MWVLSRMNDKNLNILQVSLIQNKTMYVSLFVGMLIRKISQTARLIVLQISAKLLSVDYPNRESEAACF